MILHHLPIEGARLIEAEPFSDDRGLFERVYCRRELSSLTDSQIVQINHSVTRRRGAVRGMHFQFPPMAEAKMVRCVRGAVWDVLVDLRRGSKTFLQWHAVELTGVGMDTVYVPRGCAHGFQTLEDDAELLYLHTEFYSPSHEGGVRYDDPRVGIRWPLPVTDVSERDRAHCLLTGSFEGIDL